VQLAPAHVHGIDPGRAPLEEAIAEAAGGGAHVQGDPALDRDLEGLQDLGQFQSAPADIGQGLDDLQRDLLGEAPAGLEAGPAGNPHLPLPHQPPGPCPAFGQPAFDQEEVQPFHEGGQLWTNFCNTFPSRAMPSSICSSLALEKFSRRAFRPPPVA